MKKINVGISILATAAGNIWSSGINQNIGFLGELLRKSPIVDGMNRGDRLQTDRKKGQSRVSQHFSLFRPEITDFNGFCIGMRWCIMPALTEPPLHEK